MSRYGKLGKNFGLLTIGSFASKLLSFFLTPFYTSILTTEEYGTADLLTVTINLLFPVLTLVISESIMRFCLDNQNDKKQIFSIGFYITAVGCILMMVLSPVVLLTQLADFYWLFVLLFVVQSFYTTLSQYIRGQERIMEYAVGGLIHSAVVIALNLLFLLVFRMGVTGYILAMILGYLSTIVYYSVIDQVWKSFLPVSKINKAVMSAMLVYSCPMILNSVSWWISDSSDKYVLSYYCGLAENGIYSIAYRIPSLLSVVTGLFISAWQISAVEDFDSEENRLFFSDVGNKYFALNIIISGWLIAFTRILAAFLFRQDYFEAWRMTPVLIIAFIFSTLSSFYGTIYTSAKQTKMLFYSTIVAAGTNIGLNFLLVPQYGGMGAAIATLISYIVIWGVRVIDSRKIMRLNLNWSKNLLSFLILLLQSIALNIYDWRTDALCFLGAIAVSLIYFDTCKEIVIIVAGKVKKAGVR